MTTDEKVKQVLSMLRKQGNTIQMAADSLLENGEIRKIKIGDGKIEMVVETRVELNISYKRLFKLLIDRDMTQRDLAEQSGVSFSTLTKMRKGEGSINNDAWDKICRTLDCSISDILEIVPYGS